MIEFVPVVGLKELGKQALYHFDKSTAGYNSVEKIVASVIYRFCVDTRCPAVFFKLPRKGDEPIAGLIYEQDFGEERFREMVKSISEISLDNFGTCDIMIYKLGEDFFLLVKNDFSQGDWTAYEYECAGKNGISISAKQIRIFGERVARSGENRG